MADDWRCIGDETHVWTAAERQANIQRMRSLSNPNDPITVTLTRKQWDVVLGYLSDTTELSGCDWEPHRQATAAIFAVFEDLGFDTHGRGEW